MSTIPTNLTVPLGQVLLTRTVTETIHPGDVFEALVRHRNGDWGDLCDEDWRLNDEALKEGSRLLSTYVDREGTKFWIITEWDRSATTVLLPEEY